MVSRYLVIALIIIGLILLITSIAREKRRRAIALKSLPSTDKPGQQENAPASTQSIRPKVYPVRYGGTPDNRFGLFIRNDGEAAFEVTVENVSVGASQLQYWKGLSVLTKDNGEVLIESYIKTDHGSGMFGSGLMAQMAKFGVDAIPLSIRYKDGENNWYVTECKLERDVLERGSGIAVKYVEQRVAGTASNVSPATQDKATVSALPHNIPDVFLEWALPNPDFPGISKDKEIIVVNRSTADYAYNVCIAPITLATTLHFAKINEIKPQGRIPVSLTAEGLENPDYQPLTRFFMAPENEHVAEERGFIKENKKGVERFSMCIPLTMTHVGRGGTCTTEILLEFDNWNGAKFELLRRS